MSVVLVTEIPEGREHGIRGGFSQPAKTAPRRFMGNLLQLLQILALPLPGTQVLEDIEHQPGADTAKGTFPAGLTARKGEKITGNVYHAIPVVHD